MSRQRPRRTRTRDMDWWADREFAETVTCPPWPKGCRAPIGTTCRHRDGVTELVNQPAHEARMRLAEHAEPAPTDTTADLTEETA